VPRPLSVQVHRIPSLTHYQTQPRPYIIADDAYMKQEVRKKGSAKGAYILGIVGVAATILMAVAVIYFGEAVRALEGYGYLGAFFISILGGATIIIPVPMLAVVFSI